MTWVFNNQIEPEVKLKPHLQPFSQTYGNIGLENRKVVKKIVE